MDVFDLLPDASGRQDTEHLEEDGLGCSICQNHNSTTAQPTKTKQPTNQQKLGFTPTTTFPGTLLLVLEQVQYPYKTTIQDYLRQLSTTRQKKTQQLYILVVLLSSK